MLSAAALGVLVSACVGVDVASGEMMILEKGYKEMVNLLAGRGMSVSSHRVVNVGVFEAGAWC